ncbi:NACHT domain-containing protein [Nocardia noduli]|uniref:NACHT domain-containing protein n=1 Tax=Nocardia noduli TaxID=2815722 RepID=UPI001C22E644|nr:ATP-binding protein [Nocardia noduli]
MSEGGDWEGVELSASTVTTTVGGGLGAKLGDLYEGYWTVLRGVLPVLEGAFSTLRVEPPGADAIEFKLAGHVTDGHSEGHQCKRSHKTTWTLNALREVGFLAGLREMTAVGCRVVFVSEQRSVIGGLATKAIKVSGDEFRRDLNADERKAYTALLSEWGIDDDVLEERLRSMSFDVIGHELLRRLTLDRLRSTVEGDPLDVVGTLWHMLKETAPKELDAVHLWDHLKQAGHGPLGGAAIDLASRMAGVADTYIHHAAVERPRSLDAIPRREAAEIVDLVTAPDPPAAVMLTGAPGTGKSHVLSQVVSELRRKGTVVGVIRLDAADPAPTAKALGTQEGVGFGDSPVAVLARAKAGRVGVLIVDQIDAMSTLSGRGDGIRWAVEEMLQELRASGDLILVMACRSEDLRFDGRLRRLVGIDGAGDLDPPKQVILADLTPGEVVLVLDRVGLDTSSMAPKLLELLRNPLNLSLFVTVLDSSDGERFSLMAIRSRMDLLARYHKWKSDKCQPQLGHNRFAETTLLIAEKMYSSGTLSVAETRLSSIADTVGVLIHHGVLVRDRKRVRFFHETYYEYLVALKVLEDGRTAADLLADGPQLLSRRGLVRAVLTLERDDPEAYCVDLTAVLDHTNRSHIRAAVLSLLSTQQEVNEDELLLVLSIAADTDDRMRHQAVRALVSKPFAAHLADSGALDAVAKTYCSATTSLSHSSLAAVRQLPATVLLYLLVEAARYRPDEAAQAALPIVKMVDRVDDWYGAITRLIFLAGLESANRTGHPLLQLFRGMVDAVHRSIALAVESDDSVNAPNEALSRIKERIVGSDMVYAVDSIIDRFPLVAADAVEAWLTVARRVADAQGTNESLFSRQGLLGDFRWQGPALRRCAEQTPLLYVQRLAELMLDDYERGSSEHRWTPTDSDLDPANGLRLDFRLYFPDSPEQESDNAFLVAVTAVTGSPAALKPVLDLFRSSETVAAQRVVAAGYCAATDSLIDDAAQWISEPRVRGLDSGSTPGWAWGAVVARVAVVGSDEQRRDALSLVDAAYQIREGREHETTANLNTPLAAEAHIVLSLLDKALGVELPDEFRRRLAQLTTVFGVAPPEPAPPVSISAWRSSPVPEPSGLDIAGWTALIADWPTEAEEEDTALANARGIRAAAKDTPSVFARLLIALPVDAPSAVVAGVLEGIAAASETRKQAGNALERAEVALYCEAIRNAIDRPHDPDVDMAIARCIHRLADQSDLPDDIVVIPSRICDIDRNPVVHDEGGTPVGLGLSQPRGVAVNTAASLLVPLPTRPQRLALLRPLLEKVATDPSESVRVFLPQALVSAWFTDAELTARLADQWLTASTSAGLEAPGLAQLLWQLKDTHPEVSAKLLHALAAAPPGPARSLAPRMATLFAVNDVELPGFGQPILQRFLDEVDDRIGVADYLTQLVSQLPIRGDTEGSTPGNTLLLELMNDESDKVREQTTWVVRYMNGQLLEYAALLEKISGTRMFAETPAMVLEALSRRLGELPDCVLAMCEQWITKWGPSAGDISTHAASEAHKVTDIVLAIYSTGSPVDVKERCLNVLDFLVEHGAGGANLKADEAIFDPNRP